MLWINCPLKLEEIVIEKRLNQIEKLVKPASKQGDESRNNECNISSIPRYATRLAKKSEHTRTHHGAHLKNCTTEKARLELIER